MAKFDRAIEAIIKNAMERGVFDDLSGKGKPLDLRENPLVAREWHKAQVKFSEVLVALNKRIEAYNAQISATVFYRLRIILDREIADAKKGRNDGDVHFWTNPVLLANPCPL